ncbi:hypothetical protein ACB098_11G121600 [Castanea mollissima]
MASHHHSLLSFAALATTFSIVLLCIFSLIEALNEGFRVGIKKCVNPTLLGAYKSPRERKNSAESLETTCYCTLRPRFNFALSCGEKRDYNIR